ncbi:hypothetical protein [Lachnospira multipara]|uniref:hypothetical protein n=1 Tax=Lachnospira multipara TaxID=28051 RepID=UPI0004812EFE|nr:hypothetical protein [Lachnospira multipara]
MRLRKLVLSAGLAVTLVASAIPALGANLAPQGSIGKTTYDSSTGEAEPVAVTPGWVTDKGASWDGTVEKTDDTDTTKVAKTTYTYTVVEGTPSSMDLLVREGIDKTYTYGERALVNKLNVTSQTVYNLDKYKVSDTLVDKETSDGNGETSSTLVFKDKDTQDTFIKNIGGEGATAGVLTIESTTNGYTVTGTITSKETEATEATLPDGYGYVIATTKGDNNDFKAYTYDDGSALLNEVALEEGKIGDDAAVYAKLTTLGVTYVIGGKTSSVANGLLFDTDSTADQAAGKVTFDEGYTATIAKGDALDKTKFEGLSEDAKSAGAFSIAVTLTSTGANRTETESALTFKIARPIDVAEGVTWYILAAHTDGTFEIIPATEAGGYITFSTSKFSTFELVYTAAAAAEDPTEEQQQEEQQPGEQQPDDSQDPATPEINKGRSDKSPTVVKSGDNSMMPIVVVSLLLALCAGSVAVYKEKKTL